MQAKHSKPKPDGAPYLLHGNVPGDDRILLDLGLCGYL